MMSKRISICLGLAITAVLTHGIVYACANFESFPPTLTPDSTYRAFFTQLIVATWGLWSQAHGFQPTPFTPALSGTDLATASAVPIGQLVEFGKFLAHLSFFACPLFGFGFFWLGSRLKIGVQLLKPLAIAIVFTTPLEGLISDTFGVLGLSMPASEAARSAVVLLLMIWSIGAIRISGWRRKAMEGATVAPSSVAQSTEMQPF